MNTGRSDGGDMDMSHPDLPPPPLVEVSGFVVDVDLLHAELAMNPVIVAGDLIAASCVPDAGVYALYDDGVSSSAAISDSQCNFTLSVSANSSFHLVVTPGSAPTYDQAVVSVGTDAISNEMAETESQSPYAAAPGIAAALGIEVSDLVQQGACILIVDGRFEEPFAQLRPASLQLASTDADVSLLALTNPMSLPNTYVQTDASPIGVFGLTVAGNTAKRTVTVQVTDDLHDGSPITYGPTACTLLPGALTIAHAVPMN